MSVAIRKN